jgi:hypothetical protein
MAIRESSPASEPSFSRRSVLTAGAAFLAGLAEVEASDREEGPYSFTATVVASEHEASGVDGVCWIELRFPDGSSITVGGASTVPVMRWLAGRRGRTVGGALDG